MTPRRTGRAEACTRADAQNRLAQAREFLEVAEIAAAENEVAESASVAASLAVLAGIAASDPPAAPDSVAGSAAGTTTVLNSLWPRSRAEDRRLR